MMSKIKLTQKEWWQVMTYDLQLYVVIGLVALGSPIYLFNGGWSGMNDFKLWLLPTTKVYGYITDTDVAGSENGYTIYRYDYSYPVGVDTRYGYSFSKEFEAEIDDEVPVIYASFAPNVSKIEGTTYNFWFWVYIGFVLLFVALIVLGFWYYKFRKTLFILKDGTVAVAQQIKFEDTGPRIDEDIRFQITYQYRVFDEPIETIYYTRNPNDADETERLVFANRDASKFIWFDDLPHALAKRLEST